MFKISEIYEAGRWILKCDYIRFSPAEISTLNTANSQMYINIPRKDSVIFLLNSCLDLILSLLKKLTIAYMQSLMIYG